MNKLKKQFTIKEELKSLTSLVLFILMLWEKAILKGILEENEASHFLLDLKILKQNL